MNDRVLDTNQGSEREAMIRAVLAKVGGLAVDAETLAVEADLFDAGLSSFATVEVMLAVEDAFDIELAESALNRQTFQTIAALMTAVHDTIASEQ